MADTKRAAGGCQCGQLRYEIDGDPMMAGKCHCVHCQKSTGSGHLMLAAYGEPQVAQTGASNEYSYEADSGGTVTNQFCPTCGGTVLSRTTSYPGMVVVRLGTLDEDLAVTPNFKVFEAHKRCWDKEWEDVPGFGAMAPKPG